MMSEVTWKRGDHAIPLLPGYSLSSSLIGAFSLGLKNGERHMQLFNSFHPDATEPQLAFCSAFPLQGSDQSSTAQRFPVNLLPASLCPLSYKVWVQTLNEFLPLSSTSAAFLLTGVWLSTPRNLWINQHATGEKEERKGERWRMATGESVSISCRWTHDAVQLLLVLLLLWNRAAERRKRGKQSWKMCVPGGVSLREEKNLPHKRYEMLCWG